MRVLLVALVTVLCATIPSRAQDPGRLPYSGSEVFRYALYKHDIEPLSKTLEANSQPRETMVVVVGDVSQLHRLYPGDSLPSYLRAGGSVLIATDGPVPGPQQDWAVRLGIQITGSPVGADPERCYREIKGRPFVMPRRRAQFGEPSPFDLFTDVDVVGPGAIATDHPSEMTVNENRNYFVKRLAGYTAGVRRIRDGDRVAEHLDNFAVSIVPQLNIGGRMIVVADHGVFFNGMMGFVEDANAPDGYTWDNGNWEFTRRTIDWLQGGGAEPRKRCLFIEDGRVIDQFATPALGGKPPMPKMPPPDVLANWLLNHANGIIDDKQKDDVFNRFIERWLGLPRLVRIFFLIVTVVFIVSCLRWMGRGQRKREPAAVITPFVHDNLLPRGGILRQRTASQIEVGNLYDAVRRRVRERFDVLGGRPGPSDKIPPILTANDLADGPVLYQSIRWLWELGYGVTPLAVPPADWDRTNILLERVTARAARGDWSFGVEA